MIEFGEGNLLASDADALVNTVNTVGVMGKGVALQFKQAFPANYRAYRAACARDEVSLGRMFVFDSGLVGPRRYIINFPTKGHWRANSRLADIDAGLDDMVRVIAERGIRSIALPALGCGNGGLDWAVVAPLIEAKLAEIDARCVVFPPAGAPAPNEMPVATARPAMTRGRAAFIALVGRYAQAAMRDRFDMVRPGASLLEIQKLMFLLQESGQPLRLNFAKGRYGPYAENLNYVLQLLEGHYIRGYGDRSRAVLDLDPIEVSDSGMAEADEWLVQEPGMKNSIERVLNLVDGWENAYGMELLGTVLFAARTDDLVASEPDRAVDFVWTWNKRKESTFPRDHIAAAWAHLKDEGWFAVPPSTSNSEPQRFRE